MRVCSAASYFLRPAYCESKSLERRLYRGCTSNQLYMCMVMLPRLQCGCHQLLAMISRRIVCLVQTHNTPRRCSRGKPRYLFVQHGHVTRHLFCCFCDGKEMKTGAESDMTSGCWYYRSSLLTPNVVQDKTDKGRHEGTLDKAGRGNVTYFC